MNLASRISAVAGLGKTLVTADVADTVARNGIGFSQIGSLRLKGIERPVPLHEAVRTT